MYSSTVFTSELDGDDWSASRPGRFIPRYPLDRRLGGPLNRSGLFRETVSINYWNLMEVVKSIFENITIVGGGRGGVEAHM
jgi:hypothetical protein